MNSPRLVRTQSAHPDFILLVEALDKDLRARDGEEHAFFAQFNGIAHLAHVVIAYIGNHPVGCGAFKPYANHTIEIKRMYVSPAYRGQGIAGKVLTELENWGKSLGFTRCILETGIKQPEAIRLYQKMGYERIPNYDQYDGVASSVCFAKGEE